MLKRFQFEDVSPVTDVTPVEQGMVTGENSFVNNKPLSTLVPYRKAVGSLLYLAAISRPDISFCVNYLRRFNDKPMTSH